MRFAPASTPFLTTDQNGSEAWPCVTTTMLTPPPAGFADALVPPVTATAAIAAASASSAPTRMDNLLRVMRPHPPPYVWTSRAAPADPSPLERGDAMPRAAHCQGCRRE